MKGVWWEGQVIDRVGFRENSALQWAWKPCGFEGKGIHLKELTWAKAGRQERLAPLDKKLGL